MTGTTKLTMAALCAGMVLFAGAPASAQAVYKCASRGAVTYSQVPCPGARDLGAKERRVSKKYAAPPQDRAVRMKRAQLSPEDRAECSALDGRLREQTELLKVHFDRELDTRLVKDKLRFRELRC